MTYETRETCRHVGQIISQQIRAHEEADGYRIARELSYGRDEVLRALTDGADPASALRSLSAALALIVPCDGTAICLKDDVIIAGNAPVGSHVRQLAAWLKYRAVGVEPFVTHNLSAEFPEAETFAPEASGLLAAVLPGNDSLTLMWFRREQVKEIAWAGNPHKTEAGADLNELNPRESFTTWKETVRGRARPWGPVEIESVRVFCPRVAFIQQQKKVRQLNHQLEEANKRLAVLASTDSLTGVANRRSFDDHLQMEWDRAGCNDRSLALIILDLDFFKQYNDYYGHIIGDKCLQRVAKALQVGRRSADLAARIGGEEFSLLLPDTEVKGAMSVAEKVRADIQMLQLPHARSPMGVLTASFGVATATAGRTGTAENFMRAADGALYEAKRQGRNRVMHGSTLDDDLIRPAAAGNASSAEGNS